MTLLALATFAGSVALAAPDAPAETVHVSGRRHRKAERAKVTARHSITIDPFRATWPAFHGRYELRLTPHLGVDVAAGTGTYNPLALRTATALTGTELPDLQLTEFEGAMSVYVGGRFARGVQLGVTARKQTATADVVWLEDETTGASSASAVNLASTTIGPHLGLKRVGKKGLTFQARVGAGWAMASASAVTVMSAEGAALPIPLATSYTGPTVFGNAGIGWSF